MTKPKTYSDLSSRRGAGKHVPPNKKVEPDKLRVLIKQGMSTKEIAARLGAQPKTIISNCHRHGLPLPGSHGATILAAEIAIAAPAVSPIRATGGRYRDILALADKEGVPYRKVLTQWHALCIPPEPLRRQA